MKRLTFRAALLCGAAAFGTAGAQTSAPVTSPDAPQTAAPVQTPAPAAKPDEKGVSSSAKHKGVTIKRPGLQSHEADAAAAAEGVSGPVEEYPAPPKQAKGPANDPALDRLVTNAMRSAVHIAAYDLDVHLSPATAGLDAHVTLKVENAGSTPMKYLPLSVSSTLDWQGASLRGGAKVTFGQHLVGTDTDHTGLMHEMVVTLPEPLTPGASVELSTFYSGTIERDATRLTRIGAPVDRAEQTDWDRITPEMTALRGFGQALWYPVAGPPQMLGDGAQLFNAVAKDRVANLAVMARLRLVVEYAGQAPDAAYFCGERRALTANPATVANDTAAPDPAAPNTGLATVDFPARPVGLRQPSLFITNGAPQHAAGGLLDLTTDHADAAARYGEAAELLKPMMQDWLGPRAETTVQLLDNDGQPFEDATLFVLPLRAEAAATLAPRLVAPLSHAWFHSNHPWLQEGMAEFLNLLWMEHAQGRDAAVAHLNQSTPLLALLEPDRQAPKPTPAGEPGISSSISSSATVATADPGQPLTNAWHDLYLRNKSAAVLWMLRDQVGEQALKQALALYRATPEQPATPEGATVDAERLEAALERTSNKDLAWFFHDWVLNDPGLPDLSINRVTPRPLAVPGGPPRAGWLVAIEVHNDGEATADVPVTVRSGTLTKTEHLRIAPHHNESTRIVFESTPEQVTVNDGTTPEIRTTTHTTTIQAKTDQP